MQEEEKNTPHGKNLTSRTISGIIWMILGSGTQVILKIGVLAVLARLVSPKEFGVMGVATMVVEFSKMFAHMGVGPAIIQREELEYRHLTTGFTLSLMMGAFFASLLLILSPYLAIFFRMPDVEPVLRVIALVFVIDSLTLIGQALMLRNMKFKLNAGIEVISYAIGYGIVGIALAYYGWGVWALVTANLCQALMLATLLVFIQPFPKKPGFDKPAFKELLFFGGGMTLARIGNFLALQGDNIVVGRTLGAQALGIYGRAYQFMVMPASLFGNAMDKTLFPAMAKVQNEKKRLAKAYLTGVSVIGFIAIPVSIVFNFLAPSIVMVLLGPKWTDVTLPLQILTCSLLFRMSYKMSDSLSRATGAVYHRAWRQIIYAVLVFAGSYIGQFWGLPGVALGVAGALVVNFLLMAHLSLQLTDLTWRDLIVAHRSGVVLGAVTGILTYAIVSLCQQTGLPHFLILFVTTIGIGIPTLGILIYFPRLIVTEELKELYEKLFLKKFKKFLPKNA